MKAVFAIDCRKLEGKEKKPFCIMGVEFCYLYLLGICMANIGWLAENIVKIVNQGIFDCRFHILPFISPYALIPFAFHILLGDPDDIAFFGHKLFKKRTIGSKIMSNLLCMTLMSVAVFAGELAAGNIWDVCFHVRLWDYSNTPLHVTQYAGLLPSLGYGLGAYLIFRLVHKPAVKFVKSKIKYSVAKGICMTLGILILLDTFFMAFQIIVLHRAPMYWTVKLW